MHLLPGELVRPDVEAAPSLRIGDEARHGHRPLRHRRQPLALAHVVPVPRGATADLLVRVEPVDVGELLVGVALGRLRLHRGVLGPGFARLVTIGAKAPAVGGGDEVPALVVEVDVIDLLDRAARERRLVLDQLLEPRLGRDRVVAPHREVPCPVRPGPHRVHARQPADVARDDPARGKEKARRRDHATPACAGGVLGIAPERVVVADTVRVVAQVVARGLVAPRLERVRDLDADPAAQVLEALLGDLRKKRRRLTGHAWAPRRSPRIREAPCG